MRVVDASLVVAALTDRTDRGWEALARLSENSPHAPELVDVETLSALRGRVRGGHLPVGRARDAATDLPSLPIIRHRHTDLVPRIWALRDNLTAYDAAYVALAELLGAPLLTLDRSWARVPGLGCEVEVLA